MFVHSLEQVEVHVHLVEQLPYTELAFDTSLEQIEVSLRFVEQPPYTGLA